MRRVKSTKGPGITALYERLSRDDDNSGDSNSIVHQKQMLEEYAQKNGFTNCVHFTDDGWSGATFDRPAWKRLIEGVQNGEITAVIVKDMSRVGRDHLQVGMFTDVLFPEKDVHFLAICNNIDSDHSETSEFAPFLNIMNEWFVRDTSKKIRSVMRSRGSSGKEHLNSNTPYGYQKDPDDPKKWIIDPEAAAVVRRIFQMTIDGMGPTTIARILSEENIERPSYYLAKRNRGTHQANCRLDKAYDWTSTTIAQIISTKEYAGYTVNFKTFTKSYKDKKPKRTTASQQAHFPGTQEAIVDEETWKLCQVLRETVRRPSESMGAANPLTGKVICADCGQPLYNHRYRGTRQHTYYLRSGEVKYADANSDYYACSTYNNTRQTSHISCTPHTVRTYILEGVLLDVIRSTCEYVEINEEEFVRQVNQNAEGAIDGQRKALQARVRSHQTRLLELDNLVKRIYEDNVRGRLPDSTFEQMLDSFQKERDDISRVLQKDTADLDALSARLSNSVSFIKLVKKYRDFSSLTPAMINEFVSKVVVHEATGVGAERTREIEVHLNYIGKFTPPVEPVVLTEEEKKAMEEREEKLKRKRASNRKYAARIRAEEKERRTQAAEKKAEQKKELLQSVRDQFLSGTTAQPQDTVDGIKSNTA